MPFVEPYPIGPFLVDAGGRLTHRNPAAPPTFHFQWRGRTVRAHIPAGDAGHHLHLTASIGRVPSTASGVEPSARQQSFALVRGLADSMPEGWRIGLMPDHRVLLHAENGPYPPVSVVELLTDITCFLVRLSPYLDLLDENGMPGTLSP